MTNMGSKVVVFSGGTATNSLTPCFNAIAKVPGADVTYVLPISDNGGSTSEILRILGGPAIGDIRSRIVRIMQDSALAGLFAHRLADHPLRAKHEWNDIVDGSHSVWRQVPVEVKEMCRAFIIHIQAELLKKSKNAHSFQYEKASVGNLFMTGARLFLGSLDASIELMMRIGRVSPNTHVIPCINTNHTHHISALLTNGDVITGQSQISHPAARPGSSDSDCSVVSNSSRATIQAKRNDFVHLMEDPLDSMVEAEQAEELEFANPVYILPELKNSQLHFSKVDDDTRLPAPIRRIIYINPYGEEVKPIGNSRAISKLKQADLIIYSIGSLMTSLMPIIILGNFADTISRAATAHKVLIVNNAYDRETDGIVGVDYIKVVVESMTRALVDYRGAKGTPITDPHAVPWRSFITDIVYLERGEIQMDWAQISEEHGIACHPINSAMLDNDTLQQVLQQISARPV
ncbi:hypothetical protein DAKH74_034570 [Maudiozyma humilis]|uniref:Uncharacterized protein n=1 Tax=Maudiozyma humilis TaxID=51915 RepID=A0AAV5S0C8_MAUHU|nr:hypothetical protein DAKH74_034570 [Kazachstania humilis]